MTTLEKFDLVAKGYRRLATKYKSTVICAVATDTADGHTHVFYCTPPNIPQVMRRLEALKIHSVDHEMVRKRIVQLAFIYGQHGGILPEDL